MAETKTEVKTEIATQHGADNIARAASQRADRLEEENKKLKDQLAQRAPKSKDADYNELKAENERLRSRFDELMDKLEGAGELAKSAKREPKPLEEKYKGTHSYRSSQVHYRQGRLYQVGEIITVTDERPSKYWTKVVAKVKTEFVDVVEENEPAKPPSVPEV